jgi:hypothetical protein
MNTHRVVTIGRRFRGPPDSANGGYACGLLAHDIAGDARVRLHRPPPLDVPLSIDRDAAGTVTMREAAQVVAEGSADDVVNDIPEPVSFDVASTASGNYRWFSGHPFPGCFVCGPERQPGDGLRSRVNGRAIVAAPWLPDVTICDNSGSVLPEVLWAALDCPSWFGLLEFEPDATVALLGQLSAHVLRRPQLAEPCVVIGWRRGRDGRKLYGGAAVFTAAGELLGSSNAVWIELKG